MDALRLDNSAPRSSTENDLVREVLASFSRYKTLLWVVLITTIVSAYGVGQLRTELYETTAKILVKLGRENTEVPATVQKGSVMTMGVRKEELDTEVQMLSSPSLVEEVVSQLGVEAFAYKPPQPQTILQTIKHYIRSGVAWTKAQLETVLIMMNLKKDLTNREKIMLGIEGALDVTAERDSQVVVVKLLYPDPDIAVRVLNTLLQIYLDRHIQVWQQVEVRDFFDAQVLLYKQKLEELEMAREEIKSRWNLVSIPEQRTLLLQQLQKLNSQIHDNEVKKRTLQAQQTSMRGQLKLLPDELRQSREVRANPSLQSIRERLVTLEQEHARLSTLYLPNAQQIQNLDKEIVGLKRLLGEEDPILPWSVIMQSNPIKQDFVKNIQGVEVQIAGLEMGTQQLRAQTTDLGEQLKRINIGERQLIAIEREYQLAEQAYLDYAKRRTESIMAQELDRRRIVNVAVLSPPNKPAQPSSPRKLLIMAISLPLGALLGGALVLLAGYMNDVVETPQDVAAINGLAYLGTFHLQDSFFLVEPSSRSNDGSASGSLVG